MDNKMKTQKTPAHSQSNDVSNNVRNNSSNKSPAHSPKERFRKEFRNWTDQRITKPHELCKHEMDNVILISIAGMSVLSLFAFYIGFITARGMC